MISYVLQWLVLAAVAIAAVMLGAIMLLVYTAFLIALLVTGK